MVYMKTLLVTSLCTVVYVACRDRIAAPKCEYLPELVYHLAHESFWGVLSMSFPQSFMVNMAIPVVEARLTMK